MTDPVRLDAGEVSTITVDRPEKLNALTVDALDAFDDALAAAEDAGARAVIVTGAGDTAFVAGADIAFMRDLSTDEARSYTAQGHRLMRRIEDFPAPVIAAINGYAFGGGMELALACDIRIASERAVLGQTEIDLGIIPGWGATRTSQARAISHPPP
jgi:enoyl-CoA hydratase/carnithine racemase